MRLGDIKKSLSRFSADMDDCEVLVTFIDSENKKIDYDNLAFVAYANLPDEKICIMLGTQGVAVEKIKQGTLKYPDGSKPNDEGFDING